jgi:hypothetical protein
MKVKEVAEKIDAHLRRLEAVQEDKRFFHASVRSIGGKVAITYVSYQGTGKLSLAHAKAYLEDLDGGFTDMHFRSPKVIAVDAAIETAKKEAVKTAERAWFVYTTYNHSTFVGSTPILKETAKLVYVERRKCCGFAATFPHDQIDKTKEAALARWCTATLDRLEDAILHVDELNALLTSDIPESEED